MNCFYMIGLAISAVILGLIVLCIVRYLYSGHLKYDEGLFLNAAGKYIQELGRSYELGEDISIEYNKIKDTKSYKLIFSRPIWTVSVIATYYSTTGLLMWTDSEGYTKVPISVKEYCLKSLNLAVEDFKTTEEKEFKRKYSIDFYV